MYEEIIKNFPTISSGIMCYMNIWDVGYFEIIKIDFSTNIYIFHIQKKSCVKTTHFPVRGFPK